MSDKNNSTADEIDLNYLFGVINRSIKSVLRTLFSAYDFLIARWYIIVILAVGGAVAGYFWQNSQEKNKTANLLLQVNFDGASYLYNAIDLLQNKLDQGDGEFLTTLGLDAEEPELLSVVLTPVVRVQDIITRFDANNDNRSLESLLKNVEFEGDDEFQLSQTFQTAYKYHVLEVSLIPTANKNVLQGLMDYLNGNPAMEAYKMETIAMLTEQLNNNNKIIDQIDELIVDIRKNPGVARTGNAAYVVEKDDDIDQFVRAKIELEKENRLVKDELLEARGIVVPMTALEIYPVKSSFTDKKMILLPVALIMGFLLLAFIRFSYVRLRAIAESEDA